MRLQSLMKNLVADQGQTSRCKIFVTSWMSVVSLIWDLLEINLLGTRTIRTGQRYGRGLIRLLDCMIG